MANHSGKRANAKAKRSPAPPTKNRPLSPKPGVAADTYAGAKAEASATAATLSSVKGTGAEATHPAVPDC
eukprot:10537383-Alexandrium_andersonii.AAC.1